jgi:putative MATE family efflux protein
MTITHENLDRRVLQLSFPAIGESLLQTSLYIVDAIMIGHLGSAPLAAVSLCGVVIWRVTYTVGCIQSGTVALVARNFGAKRADKVHAVIGQSFLLALAIGTVTTTVGLLFGGKFLRLLGAEEEVIKVGLPFLRVVFLASTANYLLFIGSGSLRASGDTLTPMLITFAMNCLNIILNYFLIFGVWIFPRLDMLGSGLASAISVVFGTIVVGIVLLSGTSLIKIRLRDLFRPDVKIIKQIIRISIPNAGEEILLSIGFLGFMRMIALQGTMTLAAHTIALRCESLSFMIGVGFSVAAATLVGQSLGQGDVSLAKRSFHRSSFLAVVSMSLVAIAFLLFARQIVSIFKPHPEVEAIAYVLLRIAAVEQPLLAFVMTYAGGIRGSGDTISPMLTQLAGNVFIRIGTSYFLAYQLEMGIVGIYYATVFDWACRSVVIYALYRRGRWQRLKL